MKSGKIGTYMRGVSGDDLLERLGLMRRSEESGWVFPALFGAGLGLAIGVGIGLAFAPKAGTEMRRDVAGRLKSDWMAAGGDGQREKSGKSAGTNVTPL